MSRRPFAALLAFAVLGACSTPPSATPPSAAPSSAPSSAQASAPPPPPFAGRRPSREEAAERFARLGVQPGQRLPSLSLVDLAGRPVDLAAMRGARPMVVVTCSLTCNIARGQQAAVAELQRRIGDRAAFVMVYTIDAHPKGDPSPYTGEEWVPPNNERDAVLVRQPKTMAERLALANEYHDRFAPGATILVDTMDDASWRALGEAPHVGLCIGADGIVTARTGWFDAKRIGDELDRALPR